MNTTKPLRRLLSFALAVLFVLAMLPTVSVPARAADDPVVAVASELITALESATPSTIQMNGGITLTTSVTMGADHMISIGNGTTLTISDDGQINTGGHTLTIIGGTGSQVVTLGEKLSSVAIRGLGTLDLANVAVTLDSSSVSMSNLNINVNSGATIDIGKTTGGTGVALNPIVLDSYNTLTINTGGQVNINAFNDVGIRNQGTVHINGGGLLIRPGSGDKYSIHNYGLLKYSSGTINAADGSVINLFTGSRVEGMGDKLKDRGTVFAASGQVTMRAAEIASSADALTGGTYVWDGTYFARAQTNIGEADITLAEDFFLYTGTAHEPTVIAKYGNRTLVENTDYTVAYSDNTAVGTATATATITGAGDFTGTKTVNFTIQENVAFAIAAKVYAGETTENKVINLPVLPDGASYAIGDVTNDSDLITGAPAIVSGNKLQFSTSSQNAGTTATILVTVSGEGFADYIITVSITAADVTTRTTRIDCYTSSSADASGDGWVWNATAKTLTLTDIAVTTTVEGTTGHAVLVGGETTIVGNGRVNLNSKQANGIRIEVTSGSGRATIQGDFGSISGATCGIYFQAYEGSQLFIDANIGTISGTNGDGIASNVSGVKVIISGKVGEIKGTKNGINTSTTIAAGAQVGKISGGTYGFNNEVKAATINAPVTVSGGTKAFFAEPTIAAGLGVTAWSKNVDGSSPESGPIDWATAKYVEIGSVKQTATISGITTPNAVYNGSAYVPTGTVAVTNGISPSSLVWQYESTDGGYKSNTAPTNAGAYKLTISVPKSNTDYSGSLVLTFTINKAVLSLTWPTASGISYGQALSDSTLSGGSTGYGSFAWTVPGTKPPVGTNSYEVTFTPSADTTKNYTFSTTNSVSVTVTAANLNVTITFDASTHRYTGSAITPDVTVTQGGTTLTPTTDYTVAYSDNINAGLATVTVTGAGNYSGEATKNFVIAPKSITITPTAGQSKTYGAADPALTYTPSETLNSFTGALSRASGEDAGTYAITLGTLSAGDNYELTLAADAVNFTINKAALTVTADAKTIAIGAAQPDYTYMVSGLTGSDTKAVVTGVTFALDNTFSSTSATTFTITPSGGTATNYTIIYVDGLLTVTDCTHGTSTATTTEPTCTDEGVTVTTCTDACKAVIATATIAPLGHDFKTYTGDTATCTAAGVETSVCDRIDCTITDTRSTVKKEHSWDGGSVTTQPTATTDGVKTFTCAACSETKTESVPATGGGTGPSGGGGGGGSTSTTPTIPADAGSGSTSVEIKSSGNDVALQLEGSKLDAIIKGAETDIVFDLSSVKNAETATIPIAAAEAFSDEGIAITIKLPEADITFPAESLAALAEAGDGAVTVEVKSVASEALSPMQAAQVGAMGTVINMDVFVGDTKVDVPVKVSIPYELKPGEDPAGVCLWFLDDDGNLTKITASFDAKTGLLTATLAHQSLYLIAYDPLALWENVFSDVQSGAWYYDKVAYAETNNLFSGYGDGRFGPNDSMTRAMFAQVLWNMAGSPTVSIDNPFDDVGNTWYNNAVLWAYESGIITGVGDGRFAPEQKITRQEMMLMLRNYADSKGYDIPENRELMVWRDANNIDTWAQDAVEDLYKAGVINHKGDDNVGAKDTATRAEAATMLQSFVRFVAEK